VIFSPSEILPVAESTGFRADVIEKVLHLLNLLNMLNSHPLLKGKLALKGGSALNLFVFNVPRLSVDIDLNYIGAVECEKMLADRPKVEQAVGAVFSREGFTVKRVPIEHAGGKWRLNYQSFTGLSGNLEVDLNFMFRQPLWEVQFVDSRAIGDFQARNIPVLDIHELAAGKLAALFARHQARDIFDAHQLLCNTELDQKRLRTAFVVYGALNRKDWRTISQEDVAFDPEELKRMLIPVLRGNSAPGGEDISMFVQRLVSECLAAFNSLSFVCAGNGVSRPHPYQRGNRAVIVNNRYRHAGPHCSEPDVALEGYKCSQTLRYRRTTRQ